MKITEIITFVAAVVWLALDIYLWHTIRKWKIRIDAEIKRTEDLGDETERLMRERHTEDGDHP